LSAMSARLIWQQCENLLETTDFMSVEHHLESNSVLSIILQHTQ